MSLSKPARSHLGDKTILDRIKEFLREFYIDSGILMCLCCEKAVEHLRKSTVVNHLKSANHLLQKDKRQRAIQQAKVGVMLGY